jgi:hypothetical protein
LLDSIDGGDAFFQASLLVAGSKNTPLAFDLFGFPLSAADQGLEKRAVALGEALTKAFPQAMAGKKFQANIYSGICFVSGAESYRLAWYDSETEGYRFLVERLQDQKTCENPFTEGMLFSTAPLNPSQFFPISRSHPGIQLGVSTLVQVRKEMGDSDYASSDILIYPLKRDREKEKGCQMKPGKGELAAVAVQFHFKQGVLQSVNLVNSIAGEC